jgi:hypothetical protein
MTQNTLTPEQQQEDAMTQTAKHTPGPLERSMACFIEDLRDHDQALFDQWDEEEDRAALKLAKQS